MSEKLRLGALPKAETVRLTVTLPAAVKIDLDRYAELYASTYGEPIDPAALVPHMLATFMKRDRAIRRAAHAAEFLAAATRNSAATSDAAPSSSETTGEGSPCR